MFAVVVIGLSAALLLALGLLAAAFVDVAFADPRRWQQEHASEEVSAALARIEALKVDPRQETSPTFGQLIEQGYFDFWLDRRKAIR